jgi:hypothetical protein
MTVLRSDVVHGVEDVFVHDVNLHADLVTEFNERILEIGEFAGDFRNVHEHDHGEKVFHDGLGDFDNIGVVFGAAGADLRKDTDGIVTDNGDNSFHFYILLFGDFLNNIYYITEQSFWKDGK